MMDLVPTFRKINATWGEGTNFEGAVLQHTSYKLGIRLFVTWMRALTLERGEGAIKLRLKGFYSWIKVI